MLKSRHLQVILFGGGFGTENLGIAALTVGAIKCILSQYPQAEISLLDYGKTSSTHSVRLQDRVVPVSVVNMRFSWRLYLANNIGVLVLLAVLLKLIPSHSLRVWVIARNKCLTRICEADLVMSISGGDSFCDMYGLERFLYISLPQILVLLLHKRLVLLPQTIGPFRRGFSRFIARYIVQQAEHVYSRDRRGLRELERLMGRNLAPGKVSFCYDLAFVLDPLPPDKLEVEGVATELGEGRPIVGLNISGLLYMGGYTRNNMFGLRADYRQFIYRLIDLLVVKKGANIILIPHVFGSRANVDSDLAVCERVYEELKSRYVGTLGLVRRFYDHSEMKYVIGQCDFFLGSRMHSCIGAVSQCIPAVSVAYSDKFIGVMETLGVESSVADARRLNETELLDVVEQVYDRRAAIRQQLERKMIEVESAVMNLFGGVLYSRLGTTRTQPACVIPQA